MDEKNNERKLGLNGCRVIALISSIIALASLAVPLQTTSSGRVPVVYGVFLLSPIQTGVWKFWGTAGTVVGSILIWLYLLFELVVTMFAIYLCVKGDEGSKKKPLIIVLINTFWSLLYMIGGLVTIAFPPSRMSPFTFAFIPFIIQIFLLGIFLTFGDIKSDVFISKKESKNMEKEEEQLSIDYSDILKTKILYTKEVENKKSRKKRKMLSSFAGALGGASLMHAQNDWDYKNNRKTDFEVTFLVIYRSGTKGTINAIEGSETYLRLIAFVDD